MKILTTTCLATLIAFSASASDDILSMSWDEIVDQAKEEGEVTWYVWFQQPLFRELTAEFTAETGIDINIPEGELNGNRQKLLAEQVRDTGDIDIYADGGDSFGGFDNADIFLGPILSILPESESLTDTINGGDGEGYAVAFWGNQTGLAYDSNRVTIDELPDTVDALSDWIEAHPFQFGFNYENGGAGPSFAQNITRNILGVADDDAPEGMPENLSPAWEWFNSREGSYTVTGSNADSLTRINDGELLIAPAWEDHLAALQRENTVGDHIALYVPDFGMNGGGNMVAIPKNAKNPAAALVFIDWLTSAETQASLNARVGTAPTNTAADASSSLISSEDRLNSTDWIGSVPIGDFVPVFIEEVIQN